MKVTNRILFLLLLLVSVSAVVTICTSCKKDDDDEEVVSSNPVVGTKWIASDGKYLNFKTETSGVFYEGDDYDKGDPYEDFSYTFNRGDNTIQFLFGDEEERAQYTSSYILFGPEKFYKE